MRRIAVLTSGGDTPGTNAAIRAGCRQANSFLQHRNPTLKPNGMSSALAW
jgi:6-phosphofructokinase